VTPNILCKIPEIFPTKLCKKTCTAIQAEVKHAIGVQLMHSRKLYSVKTGIFLEGHLKKQKFKLQIRFARFLTRVLCRYAVITARMEDSLHIFRTDNGELVESFTIRYASLRVYCFKVMECMLVSLGLPIPYGCES
jgi:hypothetical protein